MKLNRRQLIGSAAIMSIAPFSIPADAKVIEESTDLLIVGGGLAGLSAANRAVDMGVKPLVLEKLKFVGGAGMFPEGSLGVNTRYQKEHGIKTTVQQVLDAALSFHHYRADPRILRVLIERSNETIDNIQDLGVEFRGIRTVYPKEESLQTWHLFKGGAAAVVQAFVKHVESKGGRILKETPVEKLLVENGRVVGAQAKNARGDVLIIRAKKVIIATGGFPANREMLAQYVHDASALGIEPIWIRGPIVDGRMGDGIRMGQLIGAGVTGMHAICGNAPYLPDDPPINQFSGPDVLKQGRCALAQPWLWVDHTGERFFNESRGSVFVDVYNAMTASGGVLYTIFDQAKMDRMINKGAVLPFNAIVLAGVPLKELPKTWEMGMDRGWAFKADTIKELAQQIGVPYENLLTTMKKVNKYAEQGYDPDFGRKKEHLEKFDLEKGPYYALKGIRGYMLTLGGLTVTANFELKTPQGDVIPNVYAVGHDFGGIYDSSYDLKCEGSSSSFAMTSGRVAAEHAIRQLEKGR